MKFVNSACCYLGVLCISGLTLRADQVIVDDLIVQSSLAVGSDAVNGENFGFDTIRLKENNLRIKFQDTSSSSSFPTVDWSIVINDSENGGATTSPSKMLMPEPCLFESLVGLQAPLW